MTDKIFAVLEGESKPFCDIIKYSDDSDSFDAVDVVSILNAQREQAKTLKELVAHNKKFAEDGLVAIASQAEQIAELKEGIIESVNATKDALEYCNFAAPEIERYKLVVAELYES